MRRKPRQQRSRVLVQSLVDATLLTIAEHGLEAVTTVRIAERAGVSVGSLYQYFDRKEDLLEAVLEQMTQGLAQLVNQHVSTLGTQDIGGFVRALINDVWRFLEADEQRYLHLVRYWAQLDFTRFMNDLERTMTTALSNYVMLRPPARPVPELPAKVYILVNSVLFTLVRYISDPATHVSREQLIDAFAQLATQTFAADAITSIASAD